MIKTICGQEAVSKVEQNHLWRKKCYKYEMFSNLAEENGHEVVID